MLCLLDECLQGGKTFVFVQNRYDEHGVPLLYKGEAYQRCRAIVNALEPELGSKGRLVRNHIDITLDALVPAGVFQLVMAGEMYDRHEHALLVQHIEAARAHSIHDLHHMSASCI